MPLKTPSFWQKKNIFSLGLMPAAKIYECLLHFDKKRKMKERYRPSIPVISVGNLIVGGAGKTPVVMSLAEHFTNKGEKVAILSRGYGGSIKSAHQVVESDISEEVGDEPKAMYESGVADQVWVGVDRRETAKLAENKGATLIILDDGFQHWLLERDLDIVVFNGDFGFGNECLLPAGPLREPKKFLERADLIISLNKALEEKSLNKPMVVAKRKPNAKDLVGMLDKSIVAFCGIGLPQQFFNQLKKEGVKVVKTVVFPDHHFYTENDMKELMEVATDSRAQLATTPKDASKLPHSFLKRCHVVRPDFDREGKENILQAVDKILSDKGIRK